MDELQYQKALQEALAGKFRGQTAIVGKAAPQYPHSVEREYKRFVREYMAKCDEIIRTFMPELKRALGYYGPARFDEVPETPDAILAKAQRAVEEKLLSYESRNQLERIAKLNQKLSVAEWGRVIQRTLGISVFEDYYKGDFFSQIIDTWVTDNVNLVTTQPANILGRMREIVQQGQADGRRVEAIARDLNEAYGMGKRHAQLIARDQTAKLNSAITRKQQEDAGVRMYVWDTSGDQRVRASHRKMNGLYCSYDDVAVYSNDGGKTWKKKTLDMPNIKGKFVHPGEDFQCRCVAMPVFNMAGISEIPVKAVDWDHVDKFITYRDKDGNTVTETRDAFFGKGGNKK